MSLTAQRCEAENGSGVPSSDKRSGVRDVDRCHGRTLRTIWARTLHSRLDIQIHPDDSAALRAARRAITRHASHWGLATIGDDATLLACELVTNVLQHSTGPASLAVIPLKGGVRVEVHDTLPSMPARHDEDTDSTSGRGLILVEALAQSWGVEVHGAGKRVWCEIYA
ncbi:MULTISPECIES: ATP-binding protein [Streptomyces phaeochromogenes group]|uniref:ATP-binding protein n=1 Tax=Streptomyces phaeochromogenes group TaxID=2838332 RepID=UPI0033E8FCBC